MQCVYDPNVQEDLFALAALSHLSHLHCKFVCPNVRSDYAVDLETSFTAKRDAEIPDFQIELDIDFYGDHYDIMSEDIEEEIAHEMAQEREREQAMEQWHEENFSKFERIESTIVMAG